MKIRLMFTAWPSSRIFPKSAITGRSMLNKFVYIVFERSNGELVVQEINIEYSGLTLQRYLRERMHNIERGTYFQSESLLVAIGRLRKVLTTLDIDPESDCAPARVYRRLMAQLSLQEV